MITRPLDLGSKLRPPPRSYDFLFIVNGGLIVLFFTLFGSDFVLAPGISMNFPLPQVPEAVADRVRTTHTITAKSAGLIFIDEGAVGMGRLRVWLKAEAARTKDPSLLVIASTTLPFTDLTQIASAAREAGFQQVIWAAEVTRPPVADEGR